MEPLEVLLAIAIFMLAPLAVGLSMGLDRRITARMQTAAASAAAAVLRPDQAVRQAAQAGQRPSGNARRVLPAVSMPSPSPSS